MVSFCNGFLSLFLFCFIRSFMYLPSDRTLFLILSFLSYFGIHSGQQHDNQNGNCSIFILSLHSLNSNGFAIWIVKHNTSHMIGKNVQYVFKIDGMNIALSIYEALSGFTAHGFTSCYTAIP